ncbi:MAG: SpoIIIAH-like family protein [Desulfitobacteriaceae bacterium]
MFQGLSHRSLVMIMAPKAKFTLGIVLSVVLITIVLLFFSLSSPHTGSPSLDSVPVNEQISETNIQFEADQRDPLLNGEEYFVNYRLGREQYRQEVKDMLEALLNSSDVKNKAAAQAKWLELSTQITQESKLENLLKIKGFQDVIVDVNDDSVNVIVLAQGLTPNDVFLIQDTAVRVTGVRLDRILISIKK